MTRFARPLDPPVERNETCEAMIRDWAVKALGLTNPDRVGLILWTSFGLCLASHMFPRIKPAT